MGQTVAIGSYLTAENLRLGLTGLVAGLSVGLVWRLAGRVRWGGVPVVLAVLIAAQGTGHSDRVRWNAAVFFGAGVILLAAIGFAYLVTNVAGASVGVTAGSLVSAGGIYIGVPETGPAVIVGGVLTGLAGALVVTRSRWCPSAGAGVAVALGWAALSGATGRPWAAVGGALCTGLAPWFALRPLLAHFRSGRPPGTWLLGMHVMLVFLGARWIGVDPDPGWFRVVVVVLAGLAVVAATRPGR
jgi:hypothetical protein